MKEVVRFLRKIVTSISPVLSNKIMYRVKMKKKLNLKNPETFNEKINWLKIYDYPNNELVIRCADKYLVREYLKEKKLSKYLVKLIGDWDSPDDIDFEKLPNKFVLKCNHGCGYNVICSDKSKLNIDVTRQKLLKWMKEDFGVVSSEPHYSKVKKKIICEEFLEDEILDYKFFCFKGEPKFFYIAQNIEGDFHNMQADFFYADGSLADFSRTDHSHFEKKPIIPANLDEMLDISRKLSKNFDFVRVDLFNVSGKIYFSELTFTPCAGFMPLSPKEKDYEFGNMINIEKK